LKRALRNNGLSLAMFGLFALSIVGQSIVGEREFNEDQRSHGQPTVSYFGYLRTGHFVEAVFENWESEFLQMSAYVLLTVFLYQKGSAESKDPDDRPDPVDTDPREHRDDPKAPWPVHQGGWVLRLYEHSLTIALFLLFVLSFLLHAAGGAREYSAEQLEHGEQAVSMLEYLGTSRFWFESFQNWQSEFLSVGAVVVLSVFLRQRGSPESKPVAAPHGETGEEG
jgi:hypothetical protein